MQKYIVHYGELSLKGRNRSFFERRLARNIRTVLKDLGEVIVQREHSHLLVKIAPAVCSDLVETRLRPVFGIAYIAPTTVVKVTETAQDLEAIAAAALEMAHGVITPHTTFKVNTRRGNKRFPIKSPEVSREIGARIVAVTQAPVKMKNPDVTVNIQIYEDGAHIFVRRIPGAGGLPIGVSGRVTTLFSGGIDSPVAAHLLLKRGCVTDFVHFHLLPNVAQVRASKVVAMARQVLAPHRQNANLYMVSAAPFEMAMLELESRVATVVFRRFITRIAERLAEKRNALALVTGDSVGQVASQTLPNINAVARATDMPILRPLISLDKAEIIDLAKAIDTYELSIQPYKDPCSMHARRPATHAKLEHVLDVEAQIDVAALVEETLERHVELIPIVW